MGLNRVFRHAPRGAFVALVMASLAGASHSEDLPKYMAIAAAPKPQTTSPRAAAEQNVFALDKAMQGIYQDALVKYKQNLRDQNPVILALFTEAGGQMILYAPANPRSPPRLCLSRTSWPSRCRTAGWPCTNSSPRT